MDADLISYESMLVARDSANWAFWGMVAAVASAIATITTTIIAGVAALIAYKTMNSWKAQARQLQLVAAKRAIFRYRTKVEGFLLSKDINNRETFTKEMRDLLADIFHEMILAGFGSSGCPQGRLFEKLFEEHELYVSNEAKLKDVFDSVIKLQESIEVSL
ncbi:hypothetical protein AB4M04_06065 [Serratia quinivorans]|uniref:Uncharacterized protein n=1 Tax=Serratia quinivorans TaxID=137545 RepID=A0ABV3UFQ9_9GAMM